MTKVLIIEDEPLVARMYEKIVKFDKFDVVSAIGGDDGLAKARIEKPDIILLDIMMPEPNGIKVLEELKKDPNTQNIPVIMLTNLSGKHDSELALSKGAQDYWVKKEIAPEEISKRIKNILSNNAKDKTIMS